MLFAFSRGKHKKIDKGCKMRRKGYHFDVTLEYDDQEYRVKGFQSAYIPAVMYLKNGDPGYPAEGGEIEEFDVWKILDDGTEIEGDDDYDDDEGFIKALEEAVDDSYDEY